MVDGIKAFIDHHGKYQLGYIALYYILLSPSMKSLNSSLLYNFQNQYPVLIFEKAYLYF